MSTAYNAHVAVASYPLICETDTLVVVFRDVEGSVRPRVTLTAGESDTVAVVKSGPDNNVTTFTLTETITLGQLGQQADRPLPITGAATTNTVTTVGVTRGKLAAFITSVGPFESYLRQPMINPPRNSP